MVSVYMYIPCGYGARSKMDTHVPFFFFFSPAIIEKKNWFCSVRVCLHKPKDDEEEEEQKGWRTSIHTHTNLRNKTRESGRRAQGGSRVNNNKPSPLFTHSRSKTHTPPPFYITFKYIFRIKKNAGSCFLFDSILMEGGHQTHLGISILFWLIH